jgi:ABC-type transport system substrate-binding protein
VAEFVAESRLVLEANPFFVGAPPSIARVEVVRADAAELVRRFEAGELDLILPDSISLAQAQALLGRRADAVRIRPSSTQVVLQPDLSHPLLARSEARRALLQAIDRRALVTAVYGGEGQVAHAPTNGPIPTGAETYALDPAAARAALAPLLAQAGRELTLIHVEGEPEREIATLVSRDLEAAGLSIALRAVDAAEGRRLFRESRHGGLLLYSLTVAPWQSVLPHLNLPRTGSGFDLTARSPGFDERMAALLAQEQTAMIPARQAQIRASLWIRYTQLLPTLPLVFAAERVVVDPALQGWDVPPGDRFGRGLEGWYFARAPGGRTAPDLTETLED